MPQESKVRVDQTLCEPMDYTVHGILQARILEWVAFPSPGYLPNPGIKPGSPALQVDSLPAEPQGKPKNTGVGSLSLLQWILYQLSYQGSQKSKSSVFIYSRSYAVILWNIDVVGWMFSAAQSCPTLCNWTAACQAPLPWDFPGKNTGVGCPFLLPGSSRPRDRTHVSFVCCTGRSILYHWAIWEDKGVE